MAEPVRQEEQPSIPTIDKEVIHRVAMKILKATHDIELQAAIGVGDIILVDLFNNDERLFFKRDFGSRSLDQVAEDMAQVQNEQHWTQTRLSRAVGVALQYRHLDKLEAWPNLELSHFYEVLSLDYADQRVLLGQAQDQLMTVAQLRDAVREFKARRNGPQHDTRYPDDSRDSWAALMRFEAALDVQQAKLEPILPRVPCTPLALQTFKDAFAALESSVYEMKRQIVYMGYKPPPGQWDVPDENQPAPAAPVVPAAPAAPAPAATPSAGTPTAPAKRTRRPKTAKPAAKRTKRTSPPRPAKPSRRRTNAKRGKARR